MGTRPVECMVVAPLIGELRPLLRSLSARRQVASGGARLFQGRLQDQEVTAAVIGDGHDRAGRGLSWVLSLRRPRRLLLLGLAGGLSPQHRVGDLVWPGRIMKPERVMKAERVMKTARNSGSENLGWEEWLAPEGGDGLVVSADVVLGTAREKGALWHRLGRPGRAVVDLESATFAALADETGASWGVLRAVSDTQEEDLPLDFAAASDAGGHVRRLSVIGQLLAQPRALGRLMRLKRRLERCAAGLDIAAQDWILRASA